MKIRLFLLTSTLFITSAEAAQQDARAQTALAQIKVKPYVAQAICEVKGLADFCEETGLLPHTIGAQCAAFIDLNAISQQYKPLLICPDISETFSYPAPQGHFGIVINDESKICIMTTQGEDVIHLQGLLNLNTYVPKIAGTEIEDVNNYQNEVGNDTVASLSTPKHNKLDPLLYNGKIEAWTSLDRDISELSDNPHVPVYLTIFARYVKESNTIEIRIHWSNHKLGQKLIYCDNTMLRTFDAILERHRTALIHYESNVCFNAANPQIPINQTKNITLTDDEKKIFAEQTDPDIIQMINNLKANCFVIEETQIHAEPQPELPPVEIQAQQQVPAQQPVQQPIQQPAPQPSRLQRFKQYFSSIWKPFTLCAVAACTFWLLFKKR